MSWSIRTPSALATAVTSTINPTGALVINKPTGTTTNDLLVMFLVHHGSDYATLPAGWTSAAQQISGTVRGEIAYLRAGGAEPATYTVLCPDSSVMAGRIVAYVGALQSGTILRSAVTSGNPSGVMTVGSITPNLGDLLVVATMTAVESFVTTISLANGTPILASALFNNKGSGTGDLFGTDYFGFSGWWQATSANPTGAASWTQVSNGDNVGIMVVFKPEPPPPSAPTNLYPETATAIASIPDSITQDTADALSNDYTVWYSYTAQPGDHVIGLWGYGGGTPYIPRTRVFDHIPPPPYTTGAFTVGSPAGDKPVQFPVTSGVTYYFSFTRSQLTGAATLQLEIEGFTDGTVPASAFLINDDDGDFPAVAISSATDNLVYAFLRTVHGPGESMAILPTGQTIIEDNEADPDRVIWYPADFTSSTAIALPSGEDETEQFYTTNKLDTFYIVQSFSAVSPLDPVLHTISAAGVLNPTTYTLPYHSSVDGIAVNPDETILYAVVVGGIKKYDLVNHVDLGVFVATIPGTSFQRLICLTDGSVVVVCVTGTSVSAKRYNSSGALQNTYSFAGVSYDEIRIQPAADDPNSFWIWLKLGSGATQTGVSQFKNVKASDGTILDTVLGQQYEAGAYEGVVSATPERFGHSESCDFVVLPLAVEPPGEGTATITVVKDTSPDSDLTSFTMTASGGLSPGTFSLADGESQTFSHVTAGTYAVSETPVDGYFTSYSVSNGNPHDAITVADGETVIVTVSNTAVPPNAGTPTVIPIRRVRRTPHVFADNKMIFLSRLEPYLRAGIGTTSGQGIDALVMLRVSKDGGNTWGTARILSAGALGRYTKRLQAYQFGRARDWVFEISVTDPNVPWVLVDLFADIEQQAGV